ncbi:TPM domain-containing protein [Bizionia myxarmorum]|uniref:TPM domain-containing protein n=1 Tax=Bizionia myxarmorum TaxID=291186 RepID=UPI002938F1FF|nr:TPM domain-containing protein [Bizionia myxarmorum]
MLYDYEIKTKLQIALVTINSLEPYTDIQRFAMDLGNYWGVGMAGIHNGLTIVICRVDKLV